MFEQRSFEFAGGRAARPAAGAAHGQGAAVVLATGASGLGCDAACRLLERALADSGLGRLDAKVVADARTLVPAHRRRRAAQPRTVVALGAEAASELLRRPVSLSLERGRVRPLPDGGRVLVTVNPRAILRLSDGVARGREYRRLVNDLLLAIPHRRLAA